MTKEVERLLEGWCTIPYESSGGFFLVITNPLLGELVNHVEILVANHGYRLLGSIQLIFKDDGESFSAAATLQYR